MELARDPRDTKYGRSSGRKDRVPGKPLRQIVASIDIASMWCIIRYGKISDMLGGVGMCFGIDQAECFV